MAYRLIPMRGPWQYRLTHIAAAIRTLWPD